MKNFTIKLMSLFFLLMPIMAQAAWWDVLIQAVSSMDTNLQNKLDSVDANLITKLVGLDSDLQNVINREIAQLTGHSGYGTLDYDPSLMNWGQGTDSWESIVNLYQTGGSGVGKVMAQMLNEYPVLSQPDHAFNPYTADTIKNYETLSSKTALAARASSQVAFDKIKQESSIIYTLNKQIENAPNAKAAADLNNRLASETASINLQLEKLLAVMVQQNAISQQQHQIDLQTERDFYNFTGN